MHTGEDAKTARPSQLDEVRQGQVRHALETLLHSTAFNSAQRSRRFISYVVEQALLGNGHSLKERTIGVEVFDRPPDYSTGDDPIVRVQAGDVRKRLEKFNQQPEAQLLQTFITLPLGSYCPEFHFRDLSQQVQPIQPAAMQVPLAPELKEHPAEPVKEAHRSGRRLLRIVVILCAAIAALSYPAYKHFQFVSSSERFWRPVFNTGQPVLICLAKIVTYHPSKQLFDAYAAKHEPDEFQQEWQRLTQPLPLDPGYTLRWGDLRQLDEFGVATGDAYAAGELSAFFGSIQKVRQLRIGSDYSFEDLRKSPSVLVGAFNNRWTMQLSSELPYRLKEDGTSLHIQEMDGARRSWTLEEDTRGHLVDYVLVARLLNNGTGQFVVLVGGVGTFGTEAGADLITNRSSLDSVLQGLDPSWPSRNLAFVLRTAVTEGVAGPPVIVASKVW